LGRGVGVCGRRGLLENLRSADRAVVVGQRHGIRRPLCFGWKPKIRGSGGDGALVLCSSWRRRLGAHCVSADDVGSLLGDHRQGLCRPLRLRRVSRVLLVGVRTAVVDAQWWSVTGGAARGGEFCWRRACSMALPWVSPGPTLLLSGVFSESS
jgi:hypothetical protein